MTARTTVDPHEFVSLMLGRRYTRMPDGFLSRAAPTVRFAVVIVGSHVALVFARETRASTTR